MSKKYILDKEGIALKLRRMALEIAERNLDTRKIILAGIAPAGPIMNAILQKHLAQYITAEIETLDITIDNKRQPRDIRLSAEPAWEDAVLIITDDVSNSGKTQTYVLKPFLHHLPQTLQCLVLVNRSHKKYPVQPDYIGISLATTIEEYIEVEIENGELVGAWMK